MKKLTQSDVTPLRVYQNRRHFMKTAGAGLLGAALAPLAKITAADAGPPDDIPTDFDSIASYNNFYEFTTNKSRVARLSKDFVSDPWSVSVTGLVDKPRTFSPAEMVESFKPEERIYRMRCVEGWSMVIPWVGFPIKRLLEEVVPTSEARYVKFTTLMDTDRFPGQRSRWYSWPYVEGLTLDEAQNDLAIMATGIYGKDLLPQNGAPIRMVVPWKYGFKSIKSVVKIELVKRQPRSLWMAAAPNEYGFFANVNPKVSHPRWSQASERRIGEFRRRPTLMMNGYEEEVGHLYADLNLEANF